MCNNVFEVISLSVTSRFIGFTALGHFLYDFAKFVQNRLRKNRNAKSFPGSPGTEIPKKAHLAKLRYLPPRASESELRLANVVCLQNKFTTASLPTSAKSLEFKMKRCSN